MDFKEITTQAELDSLPADTIAVVRSGSFDAYGSATVWAHDSATVRAYGSATVRASESATVYAYDSATVWAHDSATVRAYDSATVWASGSATVEASGSATVWAHDSATVRAYDSATVWAYGSATVRASKFVAVHRHGITPKINGGVVIDVPDLERCDAATWADFYGTRDDDTATVYAAVDDDFVKGHSYTPTKYAPGTTVTAPDFHAGRYCGAGLHFGPTPFRARRYNTNATRYVAVKVALKDVVPLGDKIKARTCEVLHEVDIDGNRI